jgi:hypothetical protein
LPDEAFLEQTLRSPMAGCGADANLLRKLSIGEPPVRLQQAEHLQIYRLYRFDRSPPERFFRDSYISCWTKEITRRFLELEGKISLVLESTFDAVDASCGGPMRHEKG